MGWGLALGAIGGIAGSVLGAREERKGQKRAQRYNEKLIERALGEIDAGEKRSIPYLEQMLAQLDQARRDALVSTAQSEYQGYRAIRDQYRADQGATNQALASRGLYNTSAALNYQRGLSSTNARNVGNLAADLASRRSGIHLQGGQMLAQGQGAFADLYTNNAQRRAQIINGVQVQAPTGVAASYGALGGAIGDLAGSAVDAWSNWRRRPRTTSEQFGAGRNGF